MRDPEKYSWADDYRDPPRVPRVRTQVTPAGWTLFLAVLCWLAIYAGYRLVRLALS